MAAVAAPLMNELHQKAEANGHLVSTTTIHTVEERRLSGAAPTAPLPKRRSGRNQVSASEPPRLSTSSSRRDSRRSQLQQELGSLPSSRRSSHYSTEPDHVDELHKPGPPFENIFPVRTYGPARAAPAKRPSVRAIKRIEIYTDSQGVRHVNEEITRTLHRSRSPSPSSPSTPSTVKAKPVNTNLTSTTIVPSDPVPIDLDEVFNGISLPPAGNGVAGQGIRTERQGSRIGQGIRSDSIGQGIRHDSIGQGVRHGSIGQGVRTGSTIGQGIRHDSIGQDIRIGQGVRHDSIGQGVRTDPLDELSRIGVQTNAIGQGVRHDSIGQDIRIGQGIRHDSIGQRIRHESSNSQVTGRSVSVGQRVQTHSQGQELLDSGLGQRLVHGQALSHLEDIHTLSLQREFDQRSLQRQQQVSETTTTGSTTNVGEYELVHRKSSVSTDGTLTPPRPAPHAHQARDRHESNRSATLYDQVPLEDMLVQTAPVSQHRRQHSHASSDYHVSSFDELDTQERVLREIHDQVDEERAASQRSLQNSLSRQQRIDSKQQHEQQRPDCELRRAADYVPVFQDERQRSLRSAPPPRAEQRPGSNGAHDLAGTRVTEHIRLPARQPSNHSVDRPLHAQKSALKQQTAIDTSALVQRAQHGNVPVGAGARQQWSSSRSSSAARSAGPTDSQQRRVEQNGRSAAQLTGSLHRHQQQHQQQQHKTVLHHDQHLNEVIVHRYHEDDVDYHLCARHEYKAVRKGLRKVRIVEPERKPLPPQLAEQVRRGEHLARRRSSPVSVHLEAEEELRDLWPRQQGHVHVEHPVYKHFSNGHAQIQQQPADVQELSALEQALQKRRLIEQLHDERQDRILTVNLHQNGLHQQQPWYERSTLEREQRRVQGQQQHQQVQGQCGHCCPGAHVCCCGFSHKLGEQQQQQQNGNIARTLLSTDEHLYDQVPDEEVEEVRGEVEEASIQPVDQLLRQFDPDVTERKERLIVRPDHRVELCSKHEQQQHQQQGTLRSQKSVSSAGSGLLQEVRDQQQHQQVSVQHKTVHEHHHLVLCPLCVLEEQHDPDTDSVITFSDQVYEKVYSPERVKSPFRA